MNAIEILLHAIQDGILLGPSTFADVELDDVLSGRDDPAFENKWLGAFQQVKDADLNESASANLTRLREKAFRMTFQYSSDSDLSAYVCDDFEVIAKACVSDCEDDFPAVLLNSYVMGKIPHGILADSGASLHSLLAALPQTQ